jgi:hypothetical protein
MPAENGTTRAYFGDMRVTHQASLMHAQQRGTAMFGRLRRIGRHGSAPKGSIGAASAARDGSPNGSAQAQIVWRALGTTPADKELLAALLAHRPAWSNALPMDVFDGSAAEAVAPVTSASPTDFAPFGVHFPKGDPTWGHPARG